MDPQQQHQTANLLAGMGFGAVLFVFALAIIAFSVFLFWRIFSKAGLSGPLGLLCLIPGVGWLIALCVLAFSEWRSYPHRRRIPPVCRPILRQHPRTLPRLRRRSRHLPHVAAQATAAHSCHRNSRRQICTSSVKDRRKSEGDTFEPATSVHTGRGNS